MQVDIIKTGDNTYLVTVQCDSENSWTERVPEAELKSIVIRACIGDIFCTV